MTKHTLFRHAVAALAGLVALAGASAASAASLDGVWRTAEGDGLVQFRDCGASLCGYLVEKADAPAGGRLLLDRLMGQGPQAWGGGRILDPSSGKVYAGDVRRLDADRLKITGCLIRPLCGSQVWTRAR